MLTLLSFSLFAAAMAAVIGVMVSTLLPAMPRIIGLFGTASTPVAVPVSRSRATRLHPTRLAPSVLRAAA